MNKENVMKTVESIKGLVDDYEEVLKHSREKTDKINELEKQLKDTYECDTYILVDRKTLDDIADEFEAIADECDTLHSTINDINSYASSIVDDSSYADADNLACRATEQADDIRLLLKTKDEDDE
tara:strand:- start:319 stop:693 length:375 start_codon:yes stop_codon:yes gene_type:complete